MRSITVPPWWLGAGAPRWIVRSSSMSSSHSSGAACGEELCSNPQPVAGRPVIDSPSSEFGEQGHELDGRVGKAVGGLAAGTYVVSSQQTGADQALEPIGEAIELVSGSP